MGYRVDQKTHIHSELGLVMPRLASFAAALAGTEEASKGLMKATRNQVLARAGKERGHTPLLLWAFSLMYALWTSRMKPQQGEKAPAANARLFQPRSLQSADAAAVAQIARFIAQLSPELRGTLHLVYGERLSYDEVAEIFAIPVSAVMTRLARCHAVLLQFEDQGASASRSLGPAQRQSHEKPRTREWAA